MEMGKTAKQMSPGPAEAFHEDEPDNDGLDQSFYHGLVCSGNLFYIAAKDPWPCTCGACEECL